MTATAPGRVALSPIELPASQYDYYLSSKTSSNCREVANGPEYNH